MPRRPNQGNFNCHPPGTFGLIFVAIASLLFWETPGNWGYVKPIKTYLPPGSCLNVPYLTPVGLCAALPVTDAVDTLVAKMFYTSRGLLAGRQRPLAAQRRRWPPTGEA